MQEECFENFPLQSPEGKRAAKGKYIEGCLTEFAVYVALFFATLILFWTVKPLIEVQRTGVVAQSIIVVSFAAIIGFIAYMGATKHLKTRHVVMAILFAGYILRVGYMLYTPAAARQQDTFTKNFDGHEAYAWTLFESGKLPTTNDYQFYHPPLNALLQAGFMKFIYGLTEGASALFGGEYFPNAFVYGKPEYIGAERYYLYSSCQILSVLYSFVAAVVLVKTVCLFSFSEKTKLFLSAFVVFFPRQIQFAGMLNNDGIAYLLGVLAMYYALKWQRGRRWAWILLCGFAVGLGMMSKLSSATVCLPIAGIFVYQFVQTVGKKEGAMPFWKMATQYGVFLLICAPIGLWFQVYAKVRFDQGFGFVFDNLNHKLYTGNHSFFTRFIFTLDLDEYFGSLYCRPFEGNYYLFNYALRSAIFGEFSYWQGEGFAVLSILTAYMGAALLAICLIWTGVKCLRTRGKENSLFRAAGLDCKELIFVFLLVQSQVLSEIYFYMKMPYGCTMDFRYIMPLILGIALLVGVVDKFLVAEGGRGSLVLRRLTAIALTAFLISSALFYCVCI